MSPKVSHLLDDVHSVGIHANIRYFQADGTATQRWYRNEDLPEGTLISGIAYEFESLWYGLGIEVGIGI